MSGDRTVIKFSLFKVGLIMVVVASIWMWMVFSNGENISYSSKLDTRETRNYDFYLTNSGLGFYTVTIPNYSKGIVFIQILDPYQNLIAEKKIETKMAVNYFKFSQSGKYLVEITNISNGPLEIQIRVGNTEMYQLLVPAIIACIGVALIAFSGYKKLRDQSTAQPEENIS